MGGANEDVARGGAQRNNSLMVDHALQYAGRGWRVFPLQGKVPFKGSRGFLDATTDRATIEQWWTAQPNANIGLATGLDQDGHGQPFGLVVLDIDGAEGLADLQGLIKAHGPLPRTLAARTGNGAHFYWLGEDVRSSARNKLHVRGDGGYVVLPPSLHPNGRRYAWVDFTIPITPLPYWLKEWMQDGQHAQKIAQRTNDAHNCPAYLERLPSRKLADQALKALSQAESTWSSQEQKRIESALKAIPADNYEIWYKIGMILQSLQWIGSDGSDCGLELWDTWSATCAAKYPGFGGLETKWLSFGHQRRGGLGLGTLFALAQNHGWRGDEVDLKINTDSAQSNMNGASAAAVLPAVFSTPPSQTIYFDLNEWGRPKATAANTRRAIEALGITCAYDQFHDKTLVGGQVHEEFAGELSDRTEHMLRVMIERQQPWGFDPKIQNVHDAIIELGLLNAFHPILDYLDGLQWDGFKRIDHWMTDYLEVPDSDMTRVMGRIILIAAIRRIREPGTKFDQIIVLESGEGKNKSKAIELLAGRENFSDQSILTMSDQRQQEAMEGVWLYEIADMTGHSRTDVEKVKAFASRTVDRGRKAYGRNVHRKPRQCVFFGTTNEKRYLMSQTGNRRFWSFECGRIDLDALARDRDQLWAEADQAEGMGEPIRLPERYWRQAGDVQASRLEQDPWDVILEHLETHPCTIKDHPGEWRISSKDLLVGVLQIPVDRQFAVTAKRLAYVMNRLGWVGPKVFKDVKLPVRGYCKPKMP